jgi:hypothetical protein
MPNEAAVTALRMRLDALSERYEAIADDVSLLAEETGLAQFESAAGEAGWPAPPPTSLAAGSNIPSYVSTTAPARVRRTPSPTVPGVQPSAPHASA